MSRFCIVILVLSLATIGAHGTTLFPRKVNEFDLQHCAVCSFVSTFPDSKGPALVVTTFYPFGSDNVVAVPSVSDMLTGAAGNVTSIDSTAEWPNQADIVPTGAVAYAPALPPHPATADLQVPVGHARAT